MIPPPCDARSYSIILAPAGNVGPSLNSTLAFYCNLFHCVVKFQDSIGRPRGVLSHHLNLDLNSRYVRCLFRDYGSRSRKGEQVSYSRVVTSGFVDCHRRRASASVGFSSSSRHALITEVPAHDMMTLEKAPNFTFLGGCLDTSFMALHLLLHLALAAIMSARMLGQFLVSHDQCQNAFERFCRIFHASLSSEAGLGVLNNSRDCLCQPFFCYGAPNIQGHGKF